VTLARPETSAFSIPQLGRQLVIVAANLLDEALGVLATNENFRASRRAATYVFDAGRQAAGSLLPITESLITDPSRICPMREFVWAQSLHSEETAQS
jgi:hypothetical protein